MPDIKLKVNIATGEVDLKELTTALDKAMARAQGSSANGFGSTIDRVLSRGGRSATSGIESTFRNLERGANALGNKLTSIASGLYILDRFGSFVERRLLNPLEQFVQGVLLSAESFRKFEISVSNFRGGFVQAQRFDNALIRQADSGSYSIAELQTAAKQMALTGILSYRVSLATDKQAAENTQEYAKLLRKLQIISGGEDTATISTLVRQVLEGADPRAIRKLGFTGQSLANALPGGVTPADLRNNGPLTLRAIEAYANKNISDDSLERFGDLFSHRFDKLKEVFVRAGRDIGEGGGGGNGVYDRVTNGLTAIARDITDYLNSPAWSAQSQSLSDHLGNILQHVAEGVLGFIRGLAGVHSDKDAAGGIAKTIDDILETFDKGSKEFGFYGEVLGGSFRTIGEVLGAFVNKVMAIANNLEHPGRALANEASAAASSTGSYAYALLRNGPFQKNWDNYYAAQKEEKDQREHPEWYGTENLIKNYNKRHPSSQPSEKFSMLFAQLHASVPDDIWHAGEFSASMLNTPTALAEQFSTLDLGHDPYAAAVGRMKGGLLGLKGNGDKGNLIDQAREQWGAKLDAMDAAIDRYGQALVYALPGEETEKLMEEVGRLSQIRSKYQKEIAFASEHAQEEIIGGFGRNITQQIEAIAKRAGGLSSIRSLLSGNNSAAQELAKTLGLKGTSGLGFNAIPLQKQSDVFSAYMKAGEKDVNDLPRFGRSTGDSFSDIFGAGQQGMSKRNTQAEMMKFYERELLPLARQNYQNAQNSGDPLQIANAGSMVSDLSAKLRELRVAQDESIKGWIGFGDAIQDALGNRMVDALTSLETGAGKLKDVLRSLVSDILTAFNKMAVNNLMSSIGMGPNDGHDAGRSGVGGFFYQILNRMAGGAGTYASGDGNMTAPNAQGTSFGENYIGVQTAADGAMWNGGFLPLHKFANGGIVNRPVFGLVGEKPGTSEAIIPMANGSVPVSFTGGGRQSDLHVVVVNDARSAWMAGAQADWVLDVVSGDQKRGGRTFQTPRSKAA